MKPVAIIRSGLYIIVSILDKLFRQKNSNFVVLCFHSFDKSAHKYSTQVSKFEKMVKKISQTSIFCSLNDLSNYLEGRQDELSNKIMITIDDGYRSVLDIVPIVTKYKIPVTLFVIADHDRINRSQLDSQEEILSWNQIRRLHKLGWNIGCHSSTHSDFRKLNHSEQISEIRKAKLRIEEQIGEKITCFAYPRGFYTEEIVKEVLESGFVYGFSLDSSVITKSTDKLKIPRVTIDHSHNVIDIPGVYSSTWINLRNRTNKYSLWEKLFT